MQKRMARGSINFDWNRTRAFLVTAEEGSLSAAAKVLGMTQPTLSRQVAALEAELGVTLFERGGQKLVLTESGLELLQHARTMAESAERFSLSAAGQSHKLEGLVTLSVGQLDAEYRIPEIIAQLRREQPGIQLEIVVTNQTSNLTRREADIAIRNFRPTQPELIAKKLCTEKIWLYGHKSYVDQLSDDKAIQIFAFDHSNAITELLSAKNWPLAKQNFQLITAYQPMQVQLCRLGLGLMFFPESLAGVDEEFVRVNPQDGPIMEVPLWLVCHQELRTSLRVRKIFDFIAQALSTV
ncbi:LysR family transcriptional regulator [Reinekea marinisedimentorum]|uniref:DNA-binding transcriptional LysR family regulator n=1 Tax=Reinekea marinisedimentorum TaxID=230495 RepID=A0A4R3I7F3_9GAMM|nr:LysR family transcriptional regulator [Reinekea marinisedimentorum]TCS41107.1 DNA-binding transcriptional LysR family regulator [Reinekea marinisedimentorum]